jgi:hypothetical protein
MRAPRSARTAAARGELLATVPDAHVRALRAPDDVPAAGPGGLVLLLGVRTVRVAADTRRHPEPET